VKALLSSIAAGLSLATAAQANLLANGSFEVPTVPPGTFVNFATGSNAITGWTVIGPPVSVVSGTFGAPNFPAQDGIQWLDMTGPTSGGGGVQQAVATTPGQTYNLSFFVGTGFGTTSTVGVLIDGSQIATRTNSTPGAVINWEEFTVSFTAASASTLVGFQNLDPIGDDSNGLDNVSLDLAPARPVGAPEPSVLLLLAPALAGFGFLRRRNSE
jgi:hypothetical protein